MPEYRPTAADRAPLPAAYAREPRYLGYREDEHIRPFAKYFRAPTAPVQPHVRDALLGGMSPVEYGYDVDDAVRRLGRPGYEPMETGWTHLDNGVLVVNVLTGMPGVTAQMWDWWFGWHSTDTARYKLWYPDAHQFSAIGEDRSADRTLTDRQRYRGNVSYVDEYIGGVLQRLAIRFVDPAVLGFDETPGTTYVCARTTYSNVPLAVGWLVHQVRPTEDGAEMRSRFFINHPELLDLPAHSLPGGVGGRLLGNRGVRAVGNRVAPKVGGRFLPPNFGYDLLFHCASEMNHLAAFLPELYSEFSGTP